MLIIQVLLLKPWLLPFDSTCRSRVVQEVLLPDTWGNITFHVQKLTMVAAESFNAGYGRASSIKHEGDRLA